MWRQMLGHGSVKLLLLFLGRTWAIEHWGMMAMLESTSTAPFTDSRLSNSMTGFTPTPASRRILSIALRVGMSCPKQTMLCPSSALSLSEVCFAKGCCGCGIVKPVRQRAGVGVNL